MNLQYNMNKIDEGSSYNSYADHLKKLSAKRILILSIKVIQTVVK